MGRKECWEGRASDGKKGGRGPTTKARGGGVSRPPNLKTKLHPWVAVASVAIQLLARTHTHTRSDNLADCCATAFCCFCCCRCVSVFIQYGTRQEASRLNTLVS